MVGRRLCRRGSDDMSYDFWMLADVGGEHGIDIGFEANYTYNVYEMFKCAFEDDDGIRILNEKKGDECLPLLAAAIEKMETDPAKYEAMNPPNGWGSYRGALELLKDLRFWCIRAPEATMIVS